MFRMPYEAVSLWLNKIYVSVIDPDRSREAFRRTGGFSSPAFLEKADSLSLAVDSLVFDASFMGDVNAIKEFLSRAPVDVLDVLIFRFNQKMIQLDTEPGELLFPDGKPDILAALRLLLIEDDKARGGQGPSH